MPGLVGILTRMPRARVEPELNRMVATLRHEPFYEVGTWIDESLGVYVGWSARKDSFAGGMPLYNEDATVTLVFSGEEYPDPETVRRVRARGHGLAAGASSYLVHLYEDDPSFPAGLNGRFHGLLVDRNRGTATLFNDRYGMHRIYYHESPDGFYFAAEAKAILAVHRGTRRLDTRALGEFIACGCVLENRSLFEGVAVLPGAAMWVFGQGGRVRKDNYFHPREWEDQPLLEPDEYYREVRDVFSRNLPRYFEAPEPIGVSLTGGLDTRMVMAWNKATPGSLPCYTFGGMFCDSQDVIISRRVAEVCEQPHEVIPVADEFLSAFPRYAERSVYLTDGCADVSRSPDLYVNELARHIAPIRMTGLYGGEVLRRVRAFKPVAQLRGLFDRELLVHVEEANDTYARLIREHPLSFAAFRQGPWHYYGPLALEQTQVSMRSPFLDNELVRTIYRAPVSACLNDDVCLRLIADGNARLRGVRTDRGVGGRAPRLLAAASRGALEFLFKAEYAYDYGMPQSVAQIDRVLSSFHIEHLFLGRHKFSHFRVWYRDALSRYVREMLLDSRTLSRSYWNPTTVETVVNGHLSGNRNYTREIHKMLTLELVNRLFVDSQGTFSPNEAFEAQSIHAT